MSAFSLASSVSRAGPPSGAERLHAVQEGVHRGGAALGPLSEASSGTCCRRRQARAGARRGAPFRVSQGARITRGVSSSSAWRLQDWPSTADHRGQGCWGGYRASMRFALRPRRRPAGRSAATSPARRLGGGRRASHRCSRDAVSLPARRAGSRASLLARWTERAGRRRKDLDQGTSRKQPV
jgi:hypothetical protein